MASNRVWELKYVAGNPAVMSRVSTAAGGPWLRRQALADAAFVSGQNPTWRVWVEHASTGERIFESPAEVNARTAAHSKRVIEFARNNVPGFKA